MYHTLAKTYNKVNKIENLLENQKKTRNSLEVNILPSYKKNKNSYNSSEDICELNYDDNLTNISSRKTLTKRLINSDSLD